MSDSDRNLGLTPGTSEIYVPDPERYVEEYEHWHLVLQPEDKREVRGAASGLLIAKREVVLVTDLTAEEWAGMSSAIRGGDAPRKLCEKAGVTFTGHFTGPAFNNGSLAGQTQAQVHGHIYPVVKEELPAPDACNGMGAMVEALREKQRKPGFLLLQTEREGVTLRTLATDRDDLEYYRAIEENRAHLNRHGNATSKKYRTLQNVKMARLETGNKIRLGIWDGNDFKGTINARPSSDGREVEIGYWVRYGALGEGYATIAVKAFTDYLKPRFTRIFAEVHKDNEDSIKVMERAGYHAVDEFQRDWGPVISFEPTD